MLKILSRDPPDQSDSNARAQLIPDPWELLTPPLNANSIRKSWPLPTEPHPLISPAGKPDALPLPAPVAASEFSPIQVLLKDGLTLRVYEGGKLASQIGKALALLTWMGMVTQ